jgi:GT2 family glycosyltransferase
MYIKRNTIDIIGMFDTKFIPCYFEDSDYCYTAWKSNIQTLVSPKSSVIHKEGSSAGNDETIGFKKYQAINREKFLKKHGKNIDLINKKARKQSLYFNSVL